jgi:hypothetical protein
MRYSLTLLLVLMTFSAVLFLLLFRVSNVVANAALFALSIVLPALCTVLLVAGTKWQRAFCIGNLFWQGCMLEFVAISFDEFLPWGTLLDPEAWTGGGNESFKYLAVGTMVLGALTGMLCVALRWLLERRARTAG